MRRGLAWWFRFGSEVPRMRVMMDYLPLIVLGLLVFGVGCQRAVGDAPRAGGGGAASRPTTQSSQASTTQPAEGGVGHIEKTDEEWRKILSPEEYAVLRQKGTERAFTGKYDHTFEPGTYVCAACGLELFTSETKFDSRCGWPAFYAAKAGDHVKLTRDVSYGMVRTEVTCGGAGGTWVTCSTMRRISRRGSGIALIRCRSSSFRRGKRNE